MFQHQDVDGQAIGLPTGKVVCVGRNYLDHIQELQNDVPDEALLFMKPAEALCPLGEPLHVPKQSGECHNELELAILIQSPLTQATNAHAAEAIWGVGLALDLTLRDVQSKLKSKGQPWERAKSFDGSCPLSGFVPVEKFADLQQIAFNLSINGEMSQQGNSALMMRPVIDLLVEISQMFTLNPGDVVLTGTPKGVGPLLAGDTVCATLEGYFSVSTQVSSS